MSLEVDSFKLMKARVALIRVRNYLAKQKINKKPMNTELVSTYQFVEKTLDQTK